MASIKDVARLANVSIATVSRVINQNSSVKETKRHRVLEAMEILKYKPNLLASGLRAKNSRLIALALPGVSYHPFPEFIHYIEQHVKMHGYNLILGNTHDDPSIEEEFIGTLRQRNIDGILLSRVSDEGRVISILKKSNIPFVTIDREIESKDVSTVIVDNHKAGRIAAEYLLELGHKEVACILGPTNRKVCRERSEGFKEVLAENDIPLKDTHCFVGDFMMESGAAAVDKFIKKRFKITALWAINDMMAIGAMKKLQSNNIHVPNDVSVMGMDNLSIDEIIAPSLTSISQPYSEMCEEAVDLLLQQIKLSESDYVAEHRLKKIILQPRLIVRESTAEPR